jgi:hypothetical protein
MYALPPSNERRPNAMLKEEAVTLYKVISNVV